jgi:hypothetical protein
MDLLQWDSQSNWRILLRWDSAEMKCVILQPSYIPWRGYFHQIQKADVFVFFDDVQYDKRGWRNRNQIKTASGLQWLTVPVLAKGHQDTGQLIKDTRICWDTDWVGKHWKAIEMAYSRAPYFRQCADVIERLYRTRPEMLADFTIDLTETIAKLLGIEGTRFVRSSSLSTAGTKTEHLINVCAAIGATHYISGPSAKDYLDEEMMGRHGISVEFMRYDYPEYPQLHGSFEPAVTILDLLFMTGGDAGRYIW